MSRSKSLGLQGTCEAPVFVFRPLVFRPPAFVLRLLSSVLKAFVFCLSSSVLKREEDKGQRTEDKGWTGREDKGQRTEDKGWDGTRGQRTEDGRQRI